jgi:hypothetical protein
MTLFLADDEAKKLSSSHAILESHGVLEPDADYNVSTLAAAIYARRWSYNIDRSGSDFRATVTTSSETSRGLHAVGVGWSVEVALAFALANALDPSR